MPVITLALVLANLLAYSLELASGSAGPFCQSHGLVPAQFMRTGDFGPLLEAMFLHANLTHLVGNLVFLAGFGTIAETELGGVRFVTLYFLAGACGGLLHTAVDPHANNAMVGCSGCVFGLIALVAARKPRFLGFALAFGSIETWHALTGGESSISYGAHIGGLATGVIFAMIVQADSFIREEGFAS